MLNAIVVKFCGFLLYLSIISIFLFKSEKNFLAVNVNAFQNYSKYSKHF